jgi:hypothetical protein
MPDVRGLRDGAVRRRGAAWDRARLEPLRLTIPGRRAADVAALVGYEPLASVLADSKVVDTGALAEAALSARHDDPDV